MLSPIYCDGAKNKKQLEEDVADARAVRDRILANRHETPLSLEAANASSSCGTCTYYVSIGGYEVRRPFPLPHAVTQEKLDLIMRIWMVESTFWTFPRFCISGSLDNVREDHFPP